ncbi:T-cell surface glycoprotein CD4 [Rhynchocyon petersi]
MNLPTSFRHLFLVLQLALLPAVTWAKEVVLGEESKMAELPCKLSHKYKTFIWKFSNETTIMRMQNDFCMPAPTGLKNRIDCKKSSWEQGSYPITIKNLEMSDSGNYICEVPNQKEEVQLLVFKLTAKPGVHLLQGQTLTLALEGPSDSITSMQWKTPLNKNKSSAKTLAVPNVGSRESGTWTCIISQNQDTLKLSKNILVLAFQKDSNAVYKKHEDQVEFSFPVTFNDEDLRGELKWQAEGTSSPTTWLTFSLKNRKIIESWVMDNKFKISEALPLSVTLPQALPQYAGSGELTLTLKKGRIQQKVSLVVMTFTHLHRTLKCEVLGPLSPNMTLSLKLENQTSNVSGQKNLVQVADPVNGTWLCELREGGKVLLKYKLEVKATDTTASQSMKLIAGLSGGIGLLVIVVLCCCCCIKCRHRQRKAARMSQIKKLLSEKKTCQCPHRLQKTCSLG